MKKPRGKVLRCCHQPRGIRTMTDLYAYYASVFAGRPMPFAYVDLDMFDENVRAILERAGTMPVCIASKSVRCVALLKRIQAASPRFHAIMGYSAREAAYQIGRAHV